MHAAPFPMTSLLLQGEGLSLPFFKVPAAAGGVAFPPPPPDLHFATAGERCECFLPLQLIVKSVAYCCITLPWCQALSHTLFGGEYSSAPNI